MGVSLLEEDREVETVSKYIGQATNNIAEYTAMIEGLELAQDLGYSEVLANADSELMIKQLNGQYKVKNPEIAKLYMKIKGLECKFQSVTYKHVRREFNKRADALANKALDS